MKSKFRLVLMLAAFSILSGQEAELDWVKHYGSETIRSSDDAHCIVVDTSGNYYIIGTSSRAGLVTIKYNSDGSEAWQAVQAGGIYNGIENMVIDQDGNVLVAFEGDDNFSVVKYSPDGAILWTAISPIIMSGNCDLTAITLDPQGNAYICGKDNSDYTTIKINNSGSIDWTANYDDSDLPRDICVDPDGNVIVTGQSRESGDNPEFEYCTIKYDHLGNELWVQRFAGPSSEGDYAYAIACDAAGNIYVTGQADQRPVVACTIKYMPDGTQDWVRYYDTPNNYEGIWASKILVDSNSNIYVSAQAVGGTNLSDFITIKYTTGGTEEWVRRYDGPAHGRDHAKDIALDESENITIIGNSETIVDYEYEPITIKYNPLGETVGLYHQSNPEGASSLDLRSIVIDQSGKMYLTGSVMFPGSGNRDYYTTVLDTEGHELHQSSYDSPAGNRDWSNDMVRDEFGNTYITGARKERGRPYAESFSRAFSTLKYLEDGTLDWVSEFIAPGYEENEAKAIALTPDGNIVVAGICYTEYDEDGHEWLGIHTMMYSPDGNDLWGSMTACPGQDVNMNIDLAIDASGGIVVMGGTSVIKFDADGHREWQNNLILFDDAMNSMVAVDASGQFYATGSILEGGSTDYAFYTYKFLDGVPEFAWGGIYNGPAGSNDIAQALDVDAAGNVYVTGSSLGDYEEIITVKYTSSGEQLWVAQYSGEANGDSRASAIKSDDMGNVYVTGTSMGMESMDFVTIKYDASGLESWVTRFDSPPIMESDTAISQDEATALCLDAMGNVYVTGVSNYGWANFGESYITSIRYNPDGTEEWVKAFNEPRHDMAHSINVDQTGTVYVAGNNLKAVFWGSDESEMTLLKYVQPGFVVNTETISQALYYDLKQNYPNPFNPTTTISYSLPEAGVVDLLIYDLRGRIVKSMRSECQSAGNYQNRWDGIDDSGSQVATGIYFCRLQAGSFSQTIKMLYLK